MTTALKIGLVSGSYDPITRGHTDVIRKALPLVDILWVAIARNPSKSTSYLTEQERWQTVYEALQDELDEAEFFKVKVIFADPGFIVDTCASVRANVYFRGLRNTKDFAYEQEMQQFNEDLNPNISTVFLMPSAENVKISSSAVRGMVGLSGWQLRVAKYVHSTTINVLNKKVEHIEKGYTVIAP